mmetsp:Transcript_13776/g.23666  ORF Transcript_13776/g.23666 Transcript_13776/m.23666 type:complete len:136 (+) Transcript_13776:634-1041(+)
MHVYRHQHPLPVALSFPIDIFPTAGIFHPYILNIVSAAQPLKSTRTTRPFFLPSSSPFSTRVLPLSSSLLSFSHCPPLPLPSPSSGSRRGSRRHLVENHPKDLAQRRSGANPRSRDLSPSLTATPLFLFMRAFDV